MIFNTVCGGIRQSGFTFGTISEFRISISGFFTKAPSDADLFLAFHLDERASLLRCTPALSEHSDAKSPLDMIYLAYYEEECLLLNIIQIIHRPGYQDGPVTLSKIRKIRREKTWKSRKNPEIRKSRKKSRNRGGGESGKKIRKSLRKIPKFGF